MRRTVIAVVFKNGESILMQNHVKHGFWTIPIGAAEVGEQPEEAARREMREELGIEQLVMREIVRGVQTYPQYPGEAYDVVIFEAISFDGQIRNMEPHKHKDQKFIPMDEIPERVGDVTKLLLEKRA